MSPELLAANGKTRSNVHIHRTPSREEEKLEKKTHRRVAVVRLLLSPERGRRSEQGR